MPSLAGILETALYVADLDASEQFYRRVLGARTLLGDTRMRGMAVAANAILLLFARGQSIDGDDTPRGRIPGHDGAGTQHVAFAVAGDTLVAWQRHLAEQGVTVISHVRPEQGGESVYFRDPDGHLVELATVKIWNLE